MSAASKALAERGLKAAGFRRQGHYLHRAHDDLIHGVHLQASQWPTATAGSFTVNLVVTSAWLYTSWTSRSLPSNPATALFPVVQRIGGLTPSRRDLWWEVQASSDLVAVSTEVANTVIEYGLPFFDSAANSDALLARLRAGKGLPGVTAHQALLVHAMLAAERGLPSEAQEQIRRALADAGVSPFGDTVRVIARRLGLDVIA
jgi:hypothetical protein